MKTLLAAAVTALAAAALLATPALAAPSLQFCSDMTYPPEEYLVGSTPTGSDIEIGTAIAKKIGRQAQFANTGFDGIIAALVGKKCDAIISGMNDTAERRKQVAFVDYIAVGQSLMVKSGNPHHIRKLTDLAGKSVSVEVGTTNRDFLIAESKKLKAAGKKTIDVVTFPHDTDAAAALATGKVDAYFGDAPVVAYYVAKNKSFGFAGSPINPIPVGIAVRKSDTALKASIQKAVKQLYADGTIKKILAKWKMSASALKTK